MSTATRHDFEQLGARLGHQLAVETAQFVSRAPASELDGWYRHISETVSHKVRDLILCGATDEQARIYADALRLAFADVEENRMRRELLRRGSPIRPNLTGGSS